MIVVKIELWPKGDESKAITYGAIAIVNTGGTETQGNYSFTSVGKGGQKFRSGEIKWFPRKRLLAFDLVFRVLKEMVGMRNEKTA